MTDLARRRKIMEHLAKSANNGALMPNKNGSAQRKVEQIDPFDSKTLRKSEPTLPIVGASTSKPKPTPIAPKAKDRKNEIMEHIKASSTDLDLTKNPEKKRKQKIQEHIRKSID
jgi:hypothetical protein